MNVFYIGQQDCVSSFCALSEMLAFRCLPPRAQSLRFRDGLVSCKRKKGHPTCAVIQGESEKSPLPGRSVPEEGASPADPVHIAWIYEALADKDKALQWYQEGYRKRSTMMIYLKVGSVVARGSPTINDGLYADPHYQDLLRRRNFPP